jgi:hypothetical protein
MLWRAGYDRPSLWTGRRFEAFDGGQRPAGVQAAALPAGAAPGGIAVGGGVTPPETRRGHSEPEFAGRKRSKRDWQPTGVEQGAGHRSFGGPPQRFLNSVPSDVPPTPSDWSSRHRRHWGDAALCRPHGGTRPAVLSMDYVAFPAGFEPTAPGLGILCSILLSYGNSRRCYSAAWLARQLPWQASGLTPRAAAPTVPG